MSLSHMHRPIKSCNNIIRRYIIMFLVLKIDESPKLSDNIELDAMSTNERALYNPKVKSALVS